MAGSEIERLVRSKHCGHSQFYLIGLHAPTGRALFFTTSWHARCPGRSSGGETCTPRTGRRGGCRSFSRSRVSCGGLAWRHWPSSVCTGFIIHGRSRFSAPLVGGVSPSSCCPSLLSKASTLHWRQLLRRGGCVPYRLRAMEVAFTAAEHLCSPSPPPRRFPPRTVPARPARADRRGSRRHRRPAEQRGARSRSPPGSAVPAACRHPRA